MMARGKKPQNEQGFGMAARSHSQSRAKPRLLTRLRAYGRDHLRSLVFSLGKLYRQPFATTLALMMVAIALALPACLHVLLDNFQAVSHKWHDAGQITLFLKDETSANTITRLRARFADHAKIESAEYISAEDALKELRDHSEFRHLLDGLQENPLPPVFILTPTADAKDAGSLGHLRNELQTFPEIEYVQLDIQWLQRLRAITDIVRRAVIIIGFMLAISVLLVVGNSIRLDIENRREEIEVAKLIGATNQFICRPFLYGGMWYGLLGGALALLLVLTVLLLISQPIQNLIRLYNSNFQLMFPSVSQGLALVALSIGLGLFGSWLAVRRHISRIEPT